jgi:uncharacterized protein
MTTKAPLLALALLAALPLGAAAAPVFPCTDPKNRFEAVCADRELVSLAKTVDAHFGALVRQADPVTAQLLRRDQDWFAEILGGDQAEKFADRNDPERRRIKDLLTHRLATLGSIRPAAIAATPAGTPCIRSAAMRCGSPSWRSSPTRTATTRLSAM